MKEWLTAMIEKISPVAVMTLLIGTSIVTTVAAGTKIYQAITAKDQIASRFTDTSALDFDPTPSLVAVNPEAISPTIVMPTIKPTTKPLLPTVKPALPTAVPFPTFPAAQMPVNQVSANTSAGCLVTLFGNTYNVEPLRRSHPGGDIFVCGTDMTTAYQRQHGTGLNRMQSYLYNPGQSTSGSTNPTYAPNRNEDYEDRNREEHEDDDD